MKLLGFRNAKAFKAVVGLLVLVIVSAVAVVSIKAVDGAYAGNYDIVGYFARAGEGLHQGSQVEVDGVQVGQVSAISLVHGQAKIVMSIDHGFKVPVTTSALVKPVNLFGAEEVSLHMPRGTGDPYLIPGGRLHATAVSDQLNQLFQAADPLLEKIDGTQLTNVISELNSATSGEGNQISSGIQANAKLAALLSTTLPEQIQALRSLAGFAAALAPTGATIDSISASANQVLPLFNSEEAAYQRLLGTLTAMSASLATLIYDYRPDIGTLMTSGANISRVLLARQSNVAQVIDGLDTFVTRIAEGVSPGTLPNGSHYSYFKSFITLSSLQHLLCGIFSTADPAGALATLSKVFSAARNPLGCNLSAPSAQSTAVKLVPPRSSTAQSLAAARSHAGQVPMGTSGSGTNPLSATIQKLANGIYKTIGAPSVPKRSSLGDVLRQVLGLL
ncbi:MAG: MCE family protein [Acidimicrobiales bacterium]